MMVPCPICGSKTLEIEYRDNTVIILQACTKCGFNKMPKKPDEKKTQ